jgi:hypothetical protein
MIYTCLWIKQALSQRGLAVVSEPAVSKKKVQNKIKFHSYLPTLFFIGHVIENQQIFVWPKKHAAVSRAAQAVTSHVRPIA